MNGFTHIFGKHVVLAEVCWREGWRSLGGEREHFGFGFVDVRK